MNSELTPEDIKSISKHIKRYEKKAKLWLWFRWYFLLIAIFMIGMSCHFVTLAHAVHDKNTAAYILKGKNLETDIVGKYIDARIELTQMEMALNVEIILSLILGGAMLGMLIGGWKRHEHYKLTALGFKTLISINQRSEKTSNESLKTDTA
ncbi:MAG: hypothetical protein ABSA46_15465 [Thermodesulfovibrionales bacterium]|jgi:hypothetical protein